MQLCYLSLQLLLQGWIQDFLEKGASQVEMTDVQSQKFLLKKCLICMHLHLPAFIHIISVNNKVQCNLLNAMNAQSYICLPLFLQLCDSARTPILLLTCACLTILHLNCIFRTTLLSCNPPCLIICHMSMIQVIGCIYSKSRITIPVFSNSLLFTQHCAL